MSKQHTYIIAEAGVNHNGSLDLAKSLIDAAVDAGADAVKFQSFKAEKLVTKQAPKAQYQKDNTGNEQSQYEMLKALELSFDEQRALATYCHDKGIEFMSTAFDDDSLHFLAEVLDVQRFKIGSGELTNIPFLWRHAKYGKKLILSTGMSTLEEIRQALSVLAFGYCKPEDDEPTLKKCAEVYATDAAKKMLKDKVTLLHCTSNYPASLDSIHLNAMDTLASTFDLDVGYSDHSAGILVPIAAVAKGACVIEKHFTTDRSLPGPDQKASISSAELKEMVKQIRQVETALGSSEKQPSSSELDTRQVARKSIVALEAIVPNDVFTEKNLGIMRPGTGTEPKYYWDYLGKVASRAYQAGDLIKKD